MAESALQNALNFAKEASSEGLEPKDSKTVQQEQAEKPAQSTEQKEAPTQETPNFRQAQIDQRNADGSSSSMSEAFQKARQAQIEGDGQGQAEAAGGEQEGEEASKEGFDAENKTPLDEISLDGTGASESAGAKFRKLKDTAKAEIAELQQKLEEQSKQYEALTKDISSHEEFQSLQKKAEEQERTIARIELSESKAFQDKYDNRMIGMINENLRPYIESPDIIPEAATRKWVAGILDRATNAKHDESGNTQYFLAVNEIMKTDAIPELLKQEMLTTMRDYRKLDKERHGALQDWEKSSKTLAGEAAASLERNMEAAVGSLNNISESFAQKQSAMLKELREGPDAAKYNYDGIVGPVALQAEQEVKRTVQTGVPTENLLALVHDGIQYQFQVQFTKNLVDHIQAQEKRIKELEGAAGKKRQQSPGSGNRQSVGAAGGSGQGSGSSMLDAARNRGVKFGH